uniref:Golgi to ER traffic protein 4 homolog n=1 Tax=Sus scrofa TaxID=9823 RepID=A0A8D1UQA0_PIG
MLVLESLEKAEVEVADELLGEAFSPLARSLAPEPTATPSPAPAARQARPASQPAPRWARGVLAPGSLARPHWGALPASCPPGKAKEGPLWGLLPSVGSAVGRALHRGPWGRPGTHTPPHTLAAALFAFGAKWLFSVSLRRETVGKPAAPRVCLSVLFAESLAKLFSLMDPNSPERVAFVSRALKWSSGGSGKLGHPRLHQLLALTLWKEQNYCESRYHFLHSSDGEGCANMLVEYSTSRGFRSEVDMFVAQAVLQFLCLKNKSSASVVFTTYTQKHPSIENGPPFVQPLLNFIWFLLLALDGGKLAVFTVLCEQYQPSLRRDPMYNEYLDRIGQLFFGVPPKQTASYGGLLGNLLSSLMGSSEQEGEDSQDDSSPIELD